MPDTPEKQAEVNRLQEQCYLLDNLDFVSRLMQDNAAFSTVLPVSGPLLDFHSRLEYQGARTENVFLSLKPALLSSLVPKLKFFKKTRSGEVEIKFSDKTSVSDITTAVRPNAVGIKDFSYKFAGTNEAEYKWNIEAELDFFCNTLTTLSQDVTVGKETYRYLDLIIPSRPKRVRGEGEATHSDNEDFYELKVELGWMPPTEFPTGLKGDIDLAALKQELEVQQLTLFLHPKLFDIDYREDGTILIKVTYQGRMEENARAANIFGGGRTEREIGVQQRALDRAAAEGISKAKARAIEDKAAGDAVNVDARIQQYSRLLNRLDEGNKIQYVEATPADIGIRHTSNLRAVQGGLRSSEAKAKSAKLLSTVGAEAEARIKGKMAEAPPNITSEFETVTEKGKKDKKKGLDTAKKGYSSIGAASTGKIKIHYIYLADIIEAASLESGFSEPGVKNIMLGPMEIPDLKKGGKNMVNFSLGSFPISLNYFMAFFLDRVIKNLRSDYSILTFMRELINQVVQGSVEACYGDYYGSVAAADSSPRITLQEYSITDSHFGTLNAFGSSIHVTSLPYFNTAGSKGKQVLVARVTKGFPPLVADQLVNKGRGLKDNKTREANEKRNNIVTLRLGLDKGPLKRIKFSTAAGDGLLESNLEKIVKEGAADISFLKNTYSLDVSLFGTTIFRNGQIVRVEPAIVGPDDLKVASEIFIAGYYSVITHEGRIQKGKYETDLHCTFVAPFSTKAGNNAFGAKLTSGGDSTEAKATDVAEEPSYADEVLDVVLDPVGFNR